MEFTSLSLEDFYSLTPVEFNQVVRLSLEKRSQQDDALLEKIRWLAWVTVSPHVKTKITGPEKLIKLRSEMEDVITDPDELRNLYNSIKWD